MELSFSEIVVIAVIAFLVLGPEELIRKSQQLGRYWGKLKSQINNYRILAEEEVLKKDFPQQDISLDINENLNTNEPTHDKDEA